MRQYEKLCTLETGDWGVVLLFTLSQHSCRPPTTTVTTQTSCFPYHTARLMLICNFLKTGVTIQSTISITGYMNLFQENRDPLFIHFYLSSSIHPPYINLIGDFAPSEEQWGNLSCCFCGGYYQDDVCFLRSLNLSKPLSFVYVYHQLKWPENFASSDLSLHPIIPK